jgi:hypothetical protein
MNTKIPQLVLLASFLGCSQPTEPEPITSIDGLSGGRITGDVEVNNLRAATVTSGTVSAITVDVGGDGSFAGVTANTVTTETLVVEDAVTAASLSVDAASFTERPTIGGIPLGADIVGAVSRAQGENTSATAEGSCRGTFEGSHICGEEEFFAALPHFAGSIGSLKGASVNISSSRTIQHGVLRGDVDVIDVDLIANNCRNWTSIADIEGSFFFRDGEEVAPSLTTASFISGRLVVNQDDDSGRVFLGYTTECANSAIRFVCCR